jgi:hypothetical protein
MVRVLAHVLHVSADKLLAEAEPPPAKKPRNRKGDK